MAIDSYGYADGSVQAQQWAQMADMMGHGPVVAGPSDWAVTAVSGADRRVRITAGTGFGWGVLDVVDTAVNIDLPVVSGSLVRYTTIFAHRDWDNTLTSFDNSAYYTTPNVLAGGLDDDPGVLADQPLAVVRVTGGVQVPVVVKNYRVTIDQAREGWFDWINLPLASGITNPGFGNIAQYAHSVYGDRVRMRGTAGRTGGLLDQSTIATLDTDTRPITSSRYFSVGSQNIKVGTSVYGSDIYSNTSNVAIRTTGAVVMSNHGTPDWVSFDGIEFDR